MPKRIQFFFKHFLVSLFVILTALGLIFFVWYPNPLAMALGVTQVTIMLLIIDVIIGPLLGFIVYKEGKKTLKMDLAVIFILQISALIYGLYNIYQGKPAWVAFQNSQFELVRQSDVIVSSNEKPLSLFFPKLVAVDLGATSAERNKNLFEEVETGIPAAYRPERYIPLDKATQKILKEKHSLTDLLKYNTKDNIERVLKPYATAVGWLPLRVMTGTDMVVLIDAKGAVVKVVDLRPWKLS